MLKSQARLLLVTDHYCAFAVSKLLQVETDRNMIAFSFFSEETIFTLNSVKRVDASNPQFPGNKKSHTVLLEHTPDTKQDLSRRRSVAVRHQYDRGRQF